MFKVKTFNNIAAKGIATLEELDCEVSAELSEPDAILLRSHKLQPDEIEASVKAIGRAGAGVNNVPVDICTERGVAVFNAPGANANAVKELVMAGLLLGSRGIVPGIKYVGELASLEDADAMNKLLEKEKKRFKGGEIQGKTLGVVGLGAIGSQVANMALGMGMNVIGYDPAISIEAAWRLSSEVEKMDSIEALFGRADFITLHLPVLDATRDLVNEKLLAMARPTCKILNFARSEIVDGDAVIAALDAGKLAGYIADFPKPGMIGRDDVILMPHIGASTEEAEVNCAVMAARQLHSYLRDGNVVNSVNFPPLTLERTSGFRLSICNRNVPNMLGSITSILAEHEINVIDLLNKSRDDIAYNIIDVEKKPSGAVVKELEAIDGVIVVRLL
ncbi:MAG: phosphoglycerate dehydrogenase [Gammaproteobacteria bacterium]|nr:phosphoglycerate dehydrogenase [Gammaproteobacteria bacterium]NND38728.1 phosphoglycerate dehydrogenase [Pseudomonadales bacterium]MBT8151286.1 phosphoglycerate dehydrogenase [Gammaproteobacteria bacterium]NNL10190.1 phosphoglycerate dehydrogenase [Pseudomonadales bacterium]NNM12192.1 phosphoglycerate dehydrogenase [Pseudomonadales bacterium]